jgi:hypothetical protein
LTLPLQAASTYGELTTFNIEDCPKLVDDGLFYLANRPGTPLLRKDSIALSSNGKRIKHSKIRYMDFSRGIEFNLFDIISASEENALIHRDGGIIVAFRNIGQHTGFKGFYYGQSIRDIGTVTLRSDEPGILTGDGFKLFADARFRKSLENA